jgi:hypothetical protein
LDAVVAPDEDWLCASSNALMVAGEICAPPPPDPEPGPTDACEPEGEISNGLFAFWPAPVDCADDDFDDVNALRASMADDAAPKARNMARLQQRRRSRPIARACSSASAVPRRKIQ